MSFKYNGYYYLLVSKYYDSHNGGLLELWKAPTPLFNENERVFCGVVVFDLIHPSVDTPYVITDTIEKDTFPNNQLYVYYSKLNPSADSNYPAYLVIENDIQAAIDKAIIPQSGIIQLTSGMYNIWPSPNATDYSLICF